MQESRYDDVALDVYLQSLAGVVYPLGVAMKDQGLFFLRHQKRTGLGLGIVKQVLGDTMNARFCDVQRVAMALDVQLLKYSV